jgi:two-component system sensor histidine kinase DctS
VLISYVDRDFRYRFVNRTYGTWFGTEPEKMTGSTMSDVIGPAGVESIQKYIDEVLSGKFTEYEQVITYRSGNAREIHAAYVPDFGPDGKVRGFVAIVQDVTVARESEKLAAEQSVKMINSSKLATLGEMAAGLAHEINNPLFVIHGRAERLRELAQDKTLDLPKVIQAAEIIEATSMRLSKIVRGLKNLSRDGEKDPIEEVSVLKLFTENAELCFQRFKDTGIDLQIDKVDKNLIIECRPAQISQVILNLLNNAHDAVFTDASTKWVRLGALVFEDQIQISVTDSGAGIRADLLEKIFRPFFTTKKVGSGTGLGLSISRTIVESHQGTLVLDQTSKATRFVCTFPKGQ